MIDLNFFISLAGFVLVVYRLLPLLFKKDKIEGLANEAPFSLIVPARNEEKNIERFFSSLGTDPSLDVIVIDDDSSDLTAKEAQFHNARVVRCQHKPAEWNGKAWACKAGSAMADRAFLIFTDADTLHTHHGLAQAIDHMQSEQLDVLTALPYHLTHAAWERLIGIFHLLLIVATAAFQKPTPRRLYANGQFLAFRKTFYDRIGGHDSVATELAEDMALVSRSLINGARFTVVGPGLFRVRMYDTFSDFLSGWTRNFRLGLTVSSWIAPLEIGAVMFALTGGGFHFHSGANLFLTGLTLAVLAWAQLRIGEFSVWGIVLWPLSLILFTGITLRALISLILNEPIIWKGRAYHSK